MLMFLINCFINETLSGQRDNQSLRNPERRKQMRMKERERERERERENIRVRERGS